MDRFLDLDASTRFLFTAPSSMASDAPSIATAIMTSRSVKPPCPEKLRLFPSCVRLS